MTARGRRVAGVFALALAALFLASWVGIAWQEAAAAWARAGSGVGDRLLAVLIVVLTALLSWSGLLLIALTAFLVTVGVRLIRNPVDPDEEEEDGDAPGRTRGGRGVPGPVDVPPEEAELSEGPVAACLRCGSPRMRALSFSDGVFLGGGETLAWVCHRCQWRGMPLHFDDPTAYRQFVKGLHEAEGSGEQENPDPSPPEGPGP